MATVSAPGFWRRVPCFGNLGLPIAEKEVRSLLRRNRYFWVQFFYLAVISGGVGILIATNIGQGQGPEEISRRLFRLFFLVQNVLIYLIFPAFAATTISGERSEKSFDLLVTTDLRPVEIVWGKFLGIFGNCCYFLLVTLPILATCILFGGVALSEAFENYVLLLAQAALITIYGIFVSSTSSNNLRSIIGTYALAFVVGAMSSSAIAGAFESSGLQLSLIDFFLAQLPTNFVATFVAGAVASFLILFSLCFIGAVQRLTSPEGNRVTAMRILILIMVAGVLWAIHSAAEMGQIANPNMRQPQAFEFVMFVGVFTGGLCAVLLPMLAGGNVVTPLKVAAYGQRRPWFSRLSWLLLPGGVRGFVFAALVLLACVINLFLVLGEFPILENHKPSDMIAAANSVELLQHTWGLVAVAFLMYSALAFLLSTWGVTGFLCWALVGGIAALANLYALIWVIGEHPQRLFHAYELSFLVVLGQYWSMDGARESWVPMAFGNLRNAYVVHTVITVALLATAMVSLRNRGIPIFSVARKRSSPSEKGTT